ncbi:hypothetical protein SAMN05216302_100974 [Nitrosomonas aestuarii]|uniref:Uncharacterized protein n=1 Tax=Nitrosomonas aestuarii TaxID=52441 RepID=A0A1I4AM58_9PROT|nr:hypothetical protein [Nitrosomonas aestuarii]SFK56829.1 hypothetical protein SAMN05216302_100974 [Nitrosomonas aestuarii]
MKRIIAALVFLSLTTTVHAAGPFDGIYAFDYNGDVAGFASIHEKNGLMIAVILEPSPFDSTWEALQGARNGNNVRLSSIFGTIHLVIDATFNDDNFTGAATIISCSDNDDDSSNDNDNCDTPIGTVLDLTKIF